ncbi:MAG TPA: hypothetical protein VIH61_05655 [Waddliaceae bacterium]
MKQKQTANKAEKYEEDIYFKQQIHKDKERKNNIANLYKDRPLPKSRGQSPKGK